MLSKSDKHTNMTTNIITNKYCNYCSKVRSLDEWPCKTPYCKVCWKSYTKERRLVAKSKQHIKVPDHLNKKNESDSQSQLSTKDILRKMISDSIDKCDDDLPISNMAILFTSIFMTKVVQYIPPTVNIAVQPIITEPHQPIYTGDGINKDIHSSTSDRINKILPLCTDNILMVKRTSRSGVRITKDALKYDIDDLYDYEVRWYELNDNLILDAGVLEKSGYIISGLDYTPCNSSDTSPSSEPYTEPLVNEFNDYNNIFDGYNIDDLLEQFDIS